MTSIKDDIAAIRRSTDDEELRESLRTFGWVEQFPAIQDENGVTLVGNRRMRLAKELGITPQIAVLKLGKGEEADAERLKVALVSNIGGAPLSAAERKQLAIHLYTQREWRPLQRIADALGVSKVMVHKYLAEIVNPVNNQKQPKTATNPKGSGRLKGSKAERHVKIPLDTKKAVAAAVLDDGVPVREAAKQFGMSHVSAEAAVQRLRGARGVPTPEVILSMTAQQKLDLAIQRAKEQLVIQNTEWRRLEFIRMRDEVKELYETRLAPEYRRKLDDAERVISGRRGIMTKAHYNTIIKCLHPDTCPDPDRKETFSTAFKLFRDIRIRLLDEKQDPSNPVLRPPSWADMMKAREEVRRENSERAKKGAATRKAKAGAPAKV